MKIIVDDLIKCYGGKILSGNKNYEIKDCFINSCDVKNEGTFFGLKGNNMDGSIYYKDAIKNGASVCILNDIGDIEKNDDVCIVVVENTLCALQKLAEYKRSLFKGKVIGITGSVGKTTTKELINNVLSLKYKTLKTIGNQNSQIGVALNILRLTNEEIMILEMGISKKGEMNKLAKMVKPDIMIITNVLFSHIENFKDRKELLKEKENIINYSQKGIIFVNNDNDLTIDIKNNNINKITFGIKNKSDIMAYNIIEDDNYLFFDTDILQNIKTNYTKNMIYNILPAIKIGKIFEVSKENIRVSLKEKLELNHRLEKILLKNNITLIDDTYNASLESIENAIDYIKKYDERKILVLADVLELGKNSFVIHKKIAEYIYDNKDYINIVITIGKNMKLVNNYLENTNLSLKHFDNEKLSRKYIKNMLKENDIILIKGSHGMNLINIVKELQNI